MAESVIAVIGADAEKEKACGTLPAQQRSVPAGVSGDCEGSRRGWRGRGQWGNHFHVPTTEKIVTKKQQLRYMKKEKLNKL